MKENEREWSGEREYVDRSRGSLSGIHWTVSWETILKKREWTWISVQTVLKDWKCQTEKAVFIKQAVVKDKIKILDQNDRK